MIETTFSSNIALLTINFPIELFCPILSWKPIKNPVTNAITGVCVCMYYVCMYVYVCVYVCVCMRVCVRLLFSNIIYSMWCASFIF